MVTIGLKTDKPVNTLRIPMNSHQLRQNEEDVK